MIEVDYFGDEEPILVAQVIEPDEKWANDDPDAGEEIFRACPHCGRRLTWRYDTECDFTLGVPRCLVHGDLKTWVIRNDEKGEAWGAGVLTEPGILCDPPVSLSEATVPYTSMRFKAVAPKRNLRGRKGTPLFEGWPEGQDF